MKWIILILISLGYLTIACGSRGDDGDDGDDDDGDDGDDGDSYCECDDDNDHRDDHCKCDEGNHKYIRMICMIMAGVVVVTGVVIGCCVYNKMFRSKRTKTCPEHFVTAGYDNSATIIEDIKQPIPDGDDRASVPASAPPNYSTIPYTPPGYDLSLPPPYTPTKDKY